MELNTIEHIEQSIKISGQLAGYLNGDLSDAQQDELIHWLNASDYNRDLFEKICNEKNLVNGYKLFNRFDDKEALSLVKSKLGFTRKKKIIERKLWFGILAAAAVAIIVFGVYFFNYRDHKLVSKQTGIYANDIAPGKVGATLTLANGKKIKLREVAKGEITKQAGISVTKTVDGQLVYEIKSSVQDDHKVSYNTLSTAKGETYILTLPDKSTVWINAASSLTYSTALYSHGQRRVKLIGEAYFEITKDKAHPFIVESASQEVKVLGTHFNVNSYAYENSVRTTLLEGSVQIMPLQEPKKKAILKPGEQAIVSKDFLKILPVDVEIATAWKNGNFLFRNEQVESILNRLAYWYDVEIVYQGKKPDMRMSGMIERKRKLSSVLNLIEATGKVKFKIEGRRVYVMN